MSLSVPATLPDHVCPAYPAAVNAPAHHLHIGRIEIGTITLFKEVAQ